MARERKIQVCSIWVLVAGLLFQNCVVSVTSTGLGEQKNYYPSPDPHAGTPPSGSHGTPTQERSTPSSPSLTPSNGNPPSYGGGSPPSYGGGTPPSYGGGTPPTYGGSSPPTPTIDPGTPSNPTPPFFPAPTPPIGGTCDCGCVTFIMIIDIADTIAVIASIFLEESPHADMGSAWLVGHFRQCIWCDQRSRFRSHHEPAPSTQVRESFVSALGSNSAAKAQARLFKLANEGHLKPRT
ncbi:hypothetical protein F3Y22_tig00112231pilonHSYRG00315 [Hibiscus syriacus]|uniref:Uncharacterized protein n=1 Tax=Hibiscus syriacus TaxID=106335 RepID=A0A6A2XRP9_HIBSY|nr:hypothetical protein F3Y22_tig00112231pilonHSYRG00315 [Hibiscus syriacus]